MQQRKTTYASDISGDEPHNATADVDGSPSSPDTKAQLDRASSVAFAAVEPPMCDVLSSSMQVSVQEETGNPIADEVEATPMEATAERSLAAGGADRGGAISISVAKDEPLEPAPQPSKSQGGKGKAKAIVEESGLVENSSDIDELFDDVYLAWAAEVEKKEAERSLRPIAENNATIKKNTADGPAKDVKGKGNGPSSKKRQKKTAIIELTAAEQRSPRQNARKRAAGNTAPDPTPATNPTVQKKSELQIQPEKTPVDRDEVQKLMRMANEGYRKKRESKVANASKALAPVAAATTSTVTIDNMASSIIAAVDGAFDVAKLFGRFLDQHADAFERQEAEKAQRDINECLKGSKRRVADDDGANVSEKKSKRKK
jgi:hypothetical protein